MSAGTTVILRIEDDPALYPETGAGISVYSHVDGLTPVLAVRHLQVDPCRVGETVLGLLRAKADEGGEDD